MTDDSDWSEWFEHDGRGCPIRVGTLFEATRRWADGEERTKGGVLTESMANHPSWVMQDEFGYATLVVRYRIRNPRQSTATGYAEVLKALDREAGETPYMPVKRKVGV